MSIDPENCIGAASHSPRPIETERHHIFPKYLCALLEVPERPEIVPLCGTCHSNVHHVLTTLINTGTLEGHRLSESSREIVNLAWGWWREMLEADDV